VEGREKKGLQISGREVDGNGPLASAKAINPKSPRKAKSSSPKGTHIETQNFIIETAGKKGTNVP